MPQSSDVREPVPVPGPAPAIPGHLSYARVPVRADPAGGGTDAPPYCDDHGGYVLTFTMARYVWAAVQRWVGDSSILICRADQQTVVAADSLSQLREKPGLEFLQAFLQRLVPPGDGLLLMTGSDIPAGSGLGGSGALGVAIVRALDQAYGRERSRAETAALANDIERTDLGFPGGSQDSYATAYGDIRLLEFPTQGPIGIQPVTVSHDTRLALAHHSLLIYTGQAHLSGSIHQDIRENYLRGEASTLEALHQLRSHAQAMGVALRDGCLAEYAALMARSEKSLYALHSSCDSPVLRQYFESLGPLILGGKPCGAGGGGYLLVYARPGMRHACIERAKALGGQVEPVVLDRQGVQNWWEAGLSEAALEQIRQQG